MTACRLSRRAAGFAAVVCTAEKSEKRTGSGGSFSKVSVIGRCFDDFSTDSTPLYSIPDTSVSPTLRTTSPGQSCS